MDSHYGTKGMRKVVVECPNGQNVTFQFSYVAGNNNGTSVEDGQIPEVIFYTWREKNMYINFDVVLFSEKYLWNKYSMYVRSWEKKELDYPISLHHTPHWIIYKQSKYLILIFPYVDPNVKKAQEMCKNNKFNHFI